MITIDYSFNPEIKRIERLEYANTLNSEFVFMKVYLDEDDLMIEVFSEGEYDKENFSILLDNIEHDLATLNENELTEKYLQ